jgi:murein DD-endopeptidase MepM/ murein hydrolase activator NlpD
VALPAAFGAALARTRAFRALGGAIAGGSSQSHGGRSCCLTSCAGCVACLGIAAAVALAAGGALVAATASLVGAGFGEANACANGVPKPCGVLTQNVVVAPMLCPGLFVSQGFGDTPWEHPHTGLDIVCPPGTPVTAVTAGIFHRDDGGPVACRFPVGRTGGLGIYGQLDAGRAIFLYGHLEGFAAPDGAKVVAGQVLGYEGATGCATGNHLHFEVVVAGKSVDPCPVLPAGYPAPHDRGGLRCWGSASP